MYVMEMFLSKLKGNMRKDRCQVRYRYMEVTCLTEAACRQHKELYQTVMGYFLTFYYFTDQVGLFQLQKMVAYCKH